MTTGNKEELKMKKIIIAIAALSAALSFTSCNKEEVVTGGSDIQPEAPVTVYATTGAMTKTSLRGNDTDGYQVIWSASDEIIFVNRYNPDKKAIFTLTEDGVGKTSGTFVLKDGETAPEDGDYIVYYPDTYDGTNWPASQTYAEGNIAGSPMKAQVTVADGKTPASVEFINEGGILRLTVKGTATVKSIEVRAAELSTSITLSCGSGVALTSEGTVFHIAMPSNGNEPALYSNVSIYLTDTNGNICCKSLKSGVTLEIARSQITKATFSVYSKDFYSYTTGSKVKIHGHEGIVVDLNHDNAADVIVATMNVGATVVNGSGCGGSKLAFAESYTDWSGWRLPTVDEFKTLCAPSYPAWGDPGEGEIGGTGAMIWDFDENGEFDLYLPLNDYEETEVGTNPYGKYWTGTPGENDTEKCFYFAPELDYDSGYDHNYVPVAYNYRSEEVPYKAEAAKDSEFLVRLFHDLP